MNLQGSIGEVRMTLEITRAATGKVETVELVGHVLPDNPQPEEKEQNKDGRHP
jgi:hypothetical protein